MKNIILAALCALFITPAFAQSDYEATSFPALLEEIEATEFEYVENGMMFGFISIQSCMFKSENLIVFRNYCFPVRSYPAQGYTFFSREHGVIELYEESVDDLLKRDVNITQFPAIVGPYLGSALPSMSLKDYSLILEKMYPYYFPGCWSTNHSFYTDSKDVNCSKPTEGVVGFAQWAQDTQAIVNDKDAWVSLMKRLDQKFKRR